MAAAFGRNLRCSVGRVRHVFLVLLVVPLVLLLGSVSGCRSESEIDLTRIESRVRSLMVLETAESIYRDIVYFGDSRSFLFFRTMDRRLLFAVNLHVRAGVDLADGFELRPAEDGAVTVVLAPARVLVVDTDESSIFQYFVREQGGRIGYLEFSGSIDEVKQRVADDAVERGLLHRAEENAQSMIKNLLAVAGVQDVRFAAPRSGGSP